MANKRTIIYVTREIERALGMPLSRNYRIITNRTEYGEKVREQYPEFVTLIEDVSGELIGTGDLLKHAETEKLIAALTQGDGVRPDLLVFKNTARIEPLVKERGWSLLNPPAELSERIENKVSQVMWLGELESYLPPHSLQYMKNVKWNGTPFVIQWAHGHTGDGTILIDSEEILKNIQAKFPERRTRVTEYVRGPSFTVNVVVTAENIDVGSISYQITGLAPFTDSRFSTVGNDWGVVKDILTSSDLKTLQSLVEGLGAKMQKENWRGLFGVDLIKDTESKRLLLIEINARQPASSPFESDLQNERRKNGADGMTTFEAHIAALLGEPLDKAIIEIEDGAQIIQRVTKDVQTIPEDAVGSLELAGYNVVTYENTKEKADLLRIQSANSIMAGDGAFNAKGKEIADIVSGK